jgi:GWxTD domain-containing protein
MKAKPGRIAPIFLALLGCGSWQRVGSEPSPDRTENLTQILDAQAAYRRLGRLAAGAPLPFVASVAFLAGSGDTTIALIGLSLANSALAFQKEGNEYLAHYRVDLSAQLRNGPTTQLGKDQSVRVGSFPETQRVDESVLFQDALELSPGTYHFVVAIHDKGSPNQSRAEGDLEVPGFPPGSFTAPIIAYRAKGRAERTDPIGLIINPRGALNYGGDTALAYVEAYRMPAAADVPLLLVNEDDSVVARDTLHAVGGKGVESFVYPISPENAPLGQLKIIAGNPPNTRSVTALVSFSGAWVATNFNDMMSLLRYFPAPEYLDSLRKAPPAERSALWKDFYHGTDPDPATPENEALERYFARIAIANQRFTDEDIPGWRTDRGEVLIRIGEPDEIFDASPSSEGRVIRWTYTFERLVLFFADETGFGRFKLTQASRADFEAVAARLSRKAE